MSELSEKLRRLKGKAMKPIADAAGDRRSEAKATVEAATGEKPDDDAVDAVEEDTRRRHGDVAGAGADPDALT